MYKSIFKKFLKLMTGVLLVHAKSITVEPSRPILISVPKCGTHLLRKCIASITNKEDKTDYEEFIQLSETFLDDHPNNFLLTHAIASQDNITALSKRGFKAVFIYRDPRDQIVSFAHYAGKIDPKWPKLVRLKMQDKITHLITDYSIIYGPKGWRNQGLLSLKGIDSFYNLYLPWTSQPNVYVTTFEKLVGPKGGGSEEAQFLEIKNISCHLGFSLSNDEIQDIQRKIFGGTNTFREGKIGSWRNHFTAEHKSLFKKIAGQLLIDLGYERDLNW